LVSFIPVFGRDLSAFFTPSLALQATLLAAALEVT
jgi:hypothetical protein